MAVYYYINGKKVEYGTPEYYEERRIRQEKRDARIKARNDAAAEEGKYVVGGGHGFILGSDGYVPGTGASPGTGTYMSQAEFEAAYKANPYNNWQEGDPIPQLNKNGSDWEQDNEWYGANPDYSPLDRDNPDSPTAPNPQPAPSPNDPWTGNEPPGGTDPGGGGGDGGSTPPWWGGPIGTSGPSNPINPIEIPTPTAPPPPSPGGGTGGSGGSGGSGMFGALPGIPTPGYRTENPMEFSPYGSPVSKFSDQRNYGGLPRSTGPWNEMGGYYGGNPFTTPPDDYNPPTPYPGVEPWNITGGQGPSPQWPYTPVGPSPYPGVGSNPPGWTPNPTEPSPGGPGDDVVGPTDPSNPNPDDPAPGGDNGGGDNGGGGGGGSGGGRKPGDPVSPSPQPHSVSPSDAALQQFIQAAYLNGTLGSVV